MKIEYKKCRRKDLIPAAYLIRTSLNSLRKKTGKEIRKYQIRELPEPEHLYRHDKDTFWCAWHNRKIVGFAAAIVRGRQWFLAYLFVHPRYQDKDIGKNLLYKVWRDGPGFTHSLCTFTYNMQAVGIYSKFGMAPICAIPVMGVSLEKLKVPAPTGLTYRTRLTKADLAWINQLEGKIRGYSRPQEWQFWSKFTDTRVYIFEDKGKRVGYSMTYDSGGICPTGAISNAQLVRVISEMLRIFKPKDRKIRTFCPANNINVYQMLIKSGFRLLEMDIFMADKPYPDFQRYLPAQLAIF